MARVTKKQKEIAAKLVEMIESGEIDSEEVRKNIQEENEYMEKQRKAQIPTWEQMNRRFDI